LGRNRNIFYLLKITVTTCDGSEKSTERKRKWGYYVLIAVSTSTLLEYVRYLVVLDTTYFSCPSALCLLCLRSAYRTTTVGMMWLKARLNA
jgi:hypothetical protein